jgi:hypothetical protein
VLKPFECFCSTLPEALYSTTLPSATFRDMHYQGGGVNVDMDQQRVDPVFRLKIKDWLSIKVSLGKNIGVMLSYRSACGRGHCCSHHDKLSAKGSCGKSGFCLMHEVVVGTGTKAYWHSSTIVTLVIRERCGKSLGDWCV